VEKLRVIPPFEFENWAVIALGGIPNKVQVGDMGVGDRAGNPRRTHCEEISVSPSHERHGDLKEKL